MILAGIIDSDARFAKCLQSGGSTWLWPLILRANTPEFQHRADGAPQAITRHTTLDALRESAGEAAG
jgi:hypothetical protein